MPRTPFGARVAHLVNHIFLLVDASYSMLGLKSTTVKVFDNFVAHLAERSKENGQETRISIYFFSDYGKLQCVVWDMDVLRVPSIVDLYHPGGNTALLQAFQVSMADMRKIPQQYGDHSVVFFGFTDGQENDSARPREYHVQERLVRELSQAILTAPENETYGLFVPDAEGVAEAKRFGFPAANTTIWDPTSVKGVEQAGLRLREVADAYMVGRASGVRGYSARSGGSGLFAMADFSARDVQAALTPLTPGSYYYLDVTDADCDPGRDGADITRFFETKTGSTYPRTRCYYQLTEVVKVQNHKDIAYEVGGVLYSGTLAQTRGFLGLPGDHEVKLRPDQKAGVTIFIQSTSGNRKLFPGTRLLVMR